MPSPVKTSGQGGTNGSLHWPQIRRSARFWNAAPPPVCRCADSRSAAPIFTTSSSRSSVTRRCDHEPLQHPARGSARVPPDRRDEELLADPAAGPDRAGARTDRRPGARRRRIHPRGGARPFGGHRARRDRRSLRVRGRPFPAEHAVALCPPPRARTGRPAGPLGAARPLVHPRRRRRVPRAGWNGCRHCRARRDQAGGNRELRSAHAAV